MIKDGSSGSSTKTGLLFEEKIDFIKRIENEKDFKVAKEKIGYSVIYKETNLLYLKKYELYEFLEKEFGYKSPLSTKLLPDSLILNLEKKKMFIFEVKFQEVPGSTDEKLQTCDFKKKQYIRLLSPIGIDFDYIYILNDWFRQKKYKDVLEYIKSIDCYYFFNCLPLEIFI